MTEPSPPQRRLSDRHKKWLEEADAWYFNLETMAKRIEQNERQDRRSRHRQYALTLFVLFAMLLLSYRAELAANRVDRNTQAIIMAQEVNCTSGLIILAKFNTLQDDLIRIESLNPLSDPVIKRERIAAYERAKILPLPVCKAQGRRG